MVKKTQMLERMQNKADAFGQFLCPDKALLGDLLEGLVKNEERYGYASCPCRTASGIKDYDVDIICPCEYKDADVDQYGTCYCGLYVSKEVHDEPSKLGSIPERRPVEIIDLAMEAKDKGQPVQKASVQGPASKGPSKGKKMDMKRIPIWRCVVCGYLCARELPPPICPICKAKKDRFEPFELG